MRVWNTWQVLRTTEADYWNLSELKSLTSSTFLLHRKRVSSSGKPEHTARSRGIRLESLQEQQQPWWRAHWMGLQPEPCCPSIPPAWHQQCLCLLPEQPGHVLLCGGSCWPLQQPLGTCKGQHRSTKHQGLCSTSTSEWCRTCIGALGATELLLHSAFSLPPLPLVPTATSTTIHIFIGVKDGIFCPKSHLSPCPKFSQHPEPAPSNRLMWHPRPVVLMGFAHWALHAVLCNHRSSHRGCTGLCRHPTRSGHRQQLEALGFSEHRSFSQVLFCQDCDNMRAYSGRTLPTQIYWINLVYIISWPSLLASPASRKAARFALGRVK